MKKLAKNIELEAKPFLKWAGGKGQLLPEIESSLTKLLKGKKNITFIEPFVGSGAVFFRLLQKYPSIKKAIINDINQDLINLYLVIKNNPLKLIKILQKFQNEYYSLEDEQKKKLYFLNKRKEFNTRKKDVIHQSALLIFLNRTCYNGLYRVNSSNLFNVPFGKYNKPLICDKATIMADSALLQRVEILNDDFKKTIKYIDGQTVFYFDPPYKPISTTSSFNNYASGNFNDKEQKRLALFCKKIDKQGAFWLQSNSDPCNTNPEDTFFDKLYKSFNIRRVKASRAINSNSGKRGKINELLISNF